MFALLLIPPLAALPEALRILSACYTTNAQAHPGLATGWLLYLVFVLSAATVAVISNLKGRFIALTAIGIEYRMLLHHRIVPWSRIQRARVMPGLTPGGVVVLELTDGSKRGIVAVVTPERAGEIVDSMQQRIAGAQTVTSPAGEHGETDTRPRAVEGLTPQDDRQA
jgi:hypothetical protein